jgi:UDP-glucose 4-epimerase
MNSSIQLEKAIKFEIDMNLKEIKLAIIGLGYSRRHGVRDYIHVQDLAQAHVKAVHVLLQGEERYLP